jgi:hypothetical protein
MNDQTIISSFQVGGMCDEQNADEPAWYLIPGAVHLIDSPLLYQVYLIKCILLTVVIIRTVITFFQLLAILRFWTSDSILILRYRQ